MLASLSLIYAPYFLIEVADLRPALAGLVPLIGRVVDAATDPLMGRISDHTHWRAGRRRPYFLIGLVPVGVTFALLWIDAPFGSQGARFAFYAVVYCFLSVAMTIVSVPYLALQPEMMLSYDDRTSLTAYRNGAAAFGIIAAIGMRPVADLLGGGSDGYAAAGVVFALLLALPWLGVWRVSFEREEFRTRAATLDWGEGLRLLWGHYNFRRLTGLYLAGRISMDLVGAMLILYFTHYIGRSGDFELLMLLFLPVAILSLPMWLKISHGREKVAMFRFGAVWWMCAQLLLLVAQPDWPRWALLVFAPISAIGFAVVDMMPWSMVGDVIDEDDLRCGERREGLYHGFFLFLRKLGGAGGVFLALMTLDLVGFDPDGSQSQTTVWTIRLMASVVPASFLVLAIYLSRGYGLTRSAHAEIRSTIAARKISSSASTPS